MALAESKTRKKRSKKKSFSTPFGRTRACGRLPASRPKCRALDRKRALHQNYVTLRVTSFPVPALFFSPASRNGYLTSLGRFPLRAKRGVDFFEEKIIKSHVIETLFEFLLYNPWFLARQYYANVHFIFF
jgi:hypothetical protein